MKTRSSTKRENDSQKTLHEYFKKGKIDTSKEIDNKTKLPLVESISQETETNLSDELDSELDKSFNLFQNLLTKSNSAEEVAISKEDVAPLPEINNYQYSLKKLLKDKQKSAVYKIEDTLSNSNDTENSDLDYNLDLIDDVIDIEQTSRVKQIIKEDILEHQIIVYRFFKNFNDSQEKTKSNFDKNVFINLPNNKHQTNQTNYKILINNRNPHHCLGSYQKLLCKIQDKDQSIDDIINWEDTKEFFTTLGCPSIIFDQSINISDFTISIPLRNSKLNKRAFSSDQTYISFPHYNLELFLKLWINLFKYRKSEISSTIKDQMLLIALLMNMDDMLLKHYDSLNSLINFTIADSIEPGANWMESNLLKQLSAAFPCIQNQAFENLDWFILFLNKLTNSNPKFRNFKLSLAYRCFKNCCGFDIDPKDWSYDYGIIDINAIILPNENPSSPFKINSDTDFIKLVNVLKLTSMVINPSIFNAQFSYSISKLGDFLHGLHGSIVDSRASNLDKTLVKDLLQTLYLKLYYYKHWVESTGAHQRKLTEFLSKP